MKKVIALALAGAMVFSTPVMAKEVGAPVAEYLEESSYIGIPAETVHAIDQDKLIGEHMNNAVVDIWGMDKDEVQALAIGKGAVIDGKEAPGLTFELVKPDLKRVYAAKELARDNAGTLLSVVKVHTHVAFDSAKVTFYAPGVAAGQAVTVYERIDDENWVACPTEVADNQVVVDITRNGHLAFIEGAAAAAAETEVAAQTKAAVAADTQTAAAEEVKPAAETKVEVKAETKTEVKAEAKADADEDAETEDDADADEDAETEDETEEEAGDAAAAKAGSEDATTTDER